MTARERLAESLRRIAARDAELRAFVGLNPAAPAEADAADRARAAGAGGPLLGMPVAVKDNLHVAGLPTTCGSRVLGGFLPEEDATAVARLRAAGAVIVGKTNLDEFAMGSSTETSALGPTRHPGAPDRVPGGSSGGSAAAVAAGLVPAALGSDTGGSVRQPAALCGVVGVKPTWGRVSRSGLVAFASSLDQVGPIAADARGAAAVLEAIAGPDPADATAALLPPGDWVGDCGRGVAGLRVGVLPDEPGIDREVAAAVARAAAALERAGAVLGEARLPHAAHALPAYLVLATAEASSNLARYDGIRVGPRVDPGRGFGEAVRAARAAGFGEEVVRRILLGTYVLSAGYREAYAGRARRVRTLLRRDFADAFGRADLLLGPVAPGPAFRLGERAGDPVAMYLSDLFTVPQSLAGVPAASVPAGRTADGLPLAVQLTAADWREDLLFRAAGALEGAGA